MNTFINNINEYESLGELRYLCSRGDLNISWDKSKKEEVATAKKLFNEKIKAGWTAFRE